MDINILNIHPCLFIYGQFTCRWYNIDHIFEGTKRPQGKHCLITPQQCQASYLVRVLRMDLPEAARGWLAERAGLEHVRGGGRWGREPAGTRWRSAGRLVATRGSGLFQVLIDFSVVEVFFPLGVFINLSAENIIHSMIMIKMSQIAAFTGKNVCLQYVRLVMLTQDENFECDVWCPLLWSVFFHNLATSTDMQLLRSSRGQKNNVKKDMLHSP